MTDTSIIKAANLSHNRQIDHLSQCMKKTFVFQLHQLKNIQIFMPMGFIVYLKLNAKSTYFSGITSSG